MITKLSECAPTNPPGESRNKPNKGKSEKNEKEFYAFLIRAFVIELRARRASSMSVAFFPHNIGRDIYFTSGRFRLISFDVKRIHEGFREMESSD